MRVEVVRSGRRRQTVQAQEHDGVVRVLIPASFTKAEEERWVEIMVARLRRKTTAAGIDLAERATALARRYRLPEPASIRWANNQVHRWGSCRPHDGTIRISTRLAAFPPWVLDYVIVHELAHLVEGPHNRRFRDLVARYPKAERAEGFLIAMGLHGDRPPAIDNEPSAQPALF
jgi:predicted metal-dependent hydrolase